MKRKLRIALCYTLIAAMLCQGLDISALTGIAASAKADVMFPSSLTHIEDEAFRNSRLISGLITLPGSIRAVGDRAFDETELYALDVPAKVESVGGQNLDGAAYLYIRGKNTVLGSVSGVRYIFAPAGSVAAAAAGSADFVALDSLLAYDGFYYEQTDAGAKLLCAVDADKIPYEVVIPQHVDGISVTELEADAFIGCSHVQSIQIPNTVEAAGTAFDGAPSAQISYYGGSFWITGVDVSSEEATLGESVIWVAHTNSSGAVVYQFELYCGEARVQSGSMSSVNYYSVVLNQAGTYKMKVTCQDAEGNISQMWSDPLTVLPSAVEIAAVTGENGLKAEGSTLTWQVETTGGVGDVLYDYTLYKDGEIAAERKDSLLSSYFCTAQEAGVYKLLVSCRDESGKTSSMDSAEITVYTPEQICPAAPVLTAPSGDQAFADTAETAPLFEVRDFAVAWSDATGAKSYDMALEAQINGEWTILTHKTGMKATGLTLYAYMFAPVEGETLIRLTITSHGELEGGSAVSYFRVAPVQIDASMTVDGKTALTWDYSGTKAIGRSFEIGSVLPATAVSDAEWLSVSVVDNELHAVIADALVEASERHATITVSNGVNTVVIAVNQDPVLYKPEIISPAMTQSMTDPTELPRGALIVDVSSDHKYTSLHIYEQQSNGSFKWICGSITTGSTFTLSDSVVTFKADTLYRFDLSGHYSSNYSTNELTHEQLYNSYYVKMASGRSFITIDGQSALTRYTLSKTQVDVNASNLWSWSTDSDWLSVSTTVKSSVQKNVNIYAEPNNTGAMRTSRVTFHGGDATAVLTFVQQDTSPRLLEPSWLSTDASNPTLISDNLPYYAHGKKVEWAILQNGVYTDVSELAVTNSYVTEITENVYQRELTLGAVYRITVSDDTRSVAYYIQTPAAACADSILLGLGFSCDEEFFGMAKSTKEIELSVPAAWTAEVSADWLTLSALSGVKGDATLQLTAAANTTGKDRKATITFRCTNGSFAQLYVSQDYHQFLHVEEYDTGAQSLVVSGNPSSFKLSVLHTDSWSATADADWLAFNSKGTTTSLSEKSSSSQTVYFVDDLEPGDPSRTGTVTFTSGSMTSVFTVTQHAPLAKPVLTAPEATTDEDSPGIVPYGDIVVRWNAVEGAVRYMVDMRDQYASIWRTYYVNDDGSNSYSVELDRSFFDPTVTTPIRLYLYAYDAYGKSYYQSYYFYTYTGDAVYINGVAAEAWNDASDLDVSEDFSVQASGAWTAKADQSWISVAASGNAMTVSLLKNTGAARTGTVTVTSGSTSAVLTVKQLAALADEPLLTQPGWSRDPANPTVIPLGVSEHTIKWDVEPQALWYRVFLTDELETAYTWHRSDKLYDSDGTYTITGMPLEPGIVYTLMLRRNTERGSVDTYRYVMTTDVEPWITVEGAASCELEFEGIEECLAVDIEAGAQWTAEVSDGWMVVGDDEITAEMMIANGETPADHSMHLGQSGERLYITCMANNTGAGRSGVVTLRSAGAEAKIYVTQARQYTPAELISPAMSRSRLSAPKLPYGDIVLQWTAGVDVTGEYDVRLYEYDEEASFFNRVYTKRGLTAQTLTLPVSLLTEGALYKVTLVTQLDSSTDEELNYYFRVSYQNELSAVVSVDWSRISSYGDVFIRAQATGGSGSGYQYVYKLLENGEVIQETPWENMTSYNFPVTHAGDYSVRVVVRDSTDTRYTYDSDSNSVSGAEAGRISIGQTSWSPAETGDTLQLSVSATDTWTFSENVDWLSVLRTSDTSVTVTVESNETSAARSGSVVFTCGSRSATLIVAQWAQNMVVENLELSPDQWTLVSGASDMLTLNVSASAAWTLTGCPDWVTPTAIQGTGSGAIALIADANQGAARTGTVSFICGTTVAELAVSQPGGDELPVVENFTMSRDSVLTGEEVNFRVFTENADQVILVVDGVEYESYSSTAYSAQFVRSFSQAGTAADSSRSIRFIPVRNGVRGAASAAKKLIVTSFGSLASPVIAPVRSKIIGQAAEISWSKVANADQYVVYVTYNGSNVIAPAVLSADETSLTLPASVLSALGRYSVLICATGSGYTQSEAACIFEVKEPAANFRITFPEQNDPFITHEKIDIQVDNPDENNIAIRVRRNGNIIGYLPADGGTCCNASIRDTFLFTPDAPGEYTFEAMAWLTDERGMDSTAWPKTPDKVNVQVNGAVIYEKGSYIGSGADCQSADNYSTATISTNNAVVCVELYHNGDFLGRIDYQEGMEHNYVRTFEFDVPTAGMGSHRYIAYAYDADGRSDSHIMDVYVIEMFDEALTRYPATNVPVLRELPDAVSAVVRQLRTTDKLYVAGRYGAYSYALCDGVWGFVPTNVLVEQEVVDWSNVTLKWANRPFPEDGDYYQDYCLELKHEIELYWNCSIELPEHTVYHVYITDANGNQVLAYEGRTAEAHINTLNTNLTGDCTIEIAIVTQTNIEKKVSLPLDFTFCLFRYFSEYLNAGGVVDRTLYQIEANSDLLVELHKFFIDGKGNSFGLDLASELYDFTRGNLTDGGDEVRQMVLAMSVINSMTPAETSQYMDVNNVADMLRYLKCLEGSESALKDGTQLIADMVKKGQSNAWFLKKSAAGNTVEILLDDNAIMEFANNSVFTKMEGLKLFMEVASDAVDALIMANRCMQVDYSRVSRIAAELEASAERGSDAEAVAKILRTMSTKEGIYLICLKFFGLEVSSDLINTVVQTAGKAAVNLTISALGVVVSVGCAHVVAGILLAGNVADMLMNTDAINDAYQELKWNVEYAHEYMSVYIEARDKFLRWPENEECYIDFVAKASAFSQMVSAEYEAVAKMTKASGQSILRSNEKSQELEQNLMNGAGNIRFYLKEPLDRLHSSYLSYLGIDKVDWPFPES